MAGGSAPYRKKNRATAADHAGTVFDLRLSGMSFRDIDTLTRQPDGPTQGHRISASIALQLVHEEAARRVDPKVDEYRAISLARYELALERLRNMEESVKRVMARKHITVNNGRVIRIENPETGEEEPVEDDTFILQAIDRLNRIEESRRKTEDAICRTLGLNAPQRYESQVTEVTQQDLALQEMVAELKAKNAATEQHLRDAREHPQ